MLHYATYFDRHYLTRGLALYHSLVQHSPPFTLWVLCLDATTEAVLRKLALPNVERVTLAELERADSALLTVKPDRSELEYYWTMTPALLLHLLDQHEEIELLTYLDADLFFYGDPTSLYEELGGGAILAIPSRHPPYAFEISSKSSFNVGFNMFRRSSEAMACLRRWREQCLEWCFNRYEPTRFGDQKYLDEWPARYHGFVPSENPGAGLAPTNLSSQHFSLADGRLRVDGVPVIFFHFKSLRVVHSWLYEPSFWIRRVPMTPATKRTLYAPYIRALRRAARQARAVCSAIPPRDLRPRGRRQISLPQMLLHRTLLIVTDRFVI